MSDYSLSSGFETIKNSRNNIIFFGSVGTGKTTLLNKICGQNFDARDASFSVTREVQFAYTLKHNNIFLDFPGLNSSVDVVAHLKAQKNALSFIPLRMVCFVVRYTSRYDDLIKSISQMLMIFRKYINNICLIITNSENSTITIQSEIEYQFKTKFKIDKILFTTLQSDGVELCDKLENYKKNMEYIENIIIKTSDLTQHIDPLFDFDIIDDREKYINEFEESLKVFNIEFKKAKEKDLKRALYFSLRDYKDNLIKRYTEIIKDKKADLDSIVTELIMFNNMIFNKFNDFKKNVELELDTETKNFNGEFNKYKMCPNCGKIWFLVVGCTSTRCGKRSTIKDKIYGRYKNFIVSFIGGILNISHKEEGDENKGNEEEFYGLTEKEKLENEQRKNKGLAETNPEGCGAQLNWNEMEDKTDWVLKQLKTVSDNDVSIITDIANDVKLLIEYENYEEALNTIFLEKTTNNDKLKEKKKYLNEILQKKPELEMKARNLSKQYNFNLF